MGDGGVACLPSQPHIMERFSICGGRSNGNSNCSKSMLNSSPKNGGKMNEKNMKKLKRVIKKRGELGLKSIVNSEKEVVVNNSNSCNININRNSSNVVNSEVNTNKDEVEEGELGTLPVENGEFIAETSTRKYEIRSEIERGEIVVDKWRKGGEVDKGEFLGGRWRKLEEKNESPSGSWRTSSKEELDKGEFVPDRWRKSEVVKKDDYGYSRTSRYDSAKEKGWKVEPEWTTPPPPPSGKYLSEKEHCRNANQLIKRGSRYEGCTVDRTPKISSKIVDEDGYELSNGKNNAREYSSGNRLKRQGADTDLSDRKHRGDSNDYTRSKSRKLSDNGTRTMSVDRSHKNASSSSRNVPSDRYSSRHYESSRSGYEKYNSSPHHFERSPHDQARYHDHRDWSPAHRDRSPYDRSRSQYNRSRHYDRSRSPYDRSHHYDRSRSPYDRSHHSDQRKRSPSYSEWSPQDQARCQRGRTPTFLDRSPPGHGKHRELNRKSGASEKRQSYGGSRGAEDKPNQKAPNGRDLRISVKESKDRSHVDIVNGSKIKDVIPLSNKEEPSQVPDSNGKEVPQENGSAEEVVSMEEDMDICNTPPHDSVVNNAITGKWFYLDHLGEEQGPSRLSDLKKLVEEGFLVSDHLIKHLDSDRWVTIEKAVSPLVTSNFLPIVSESITQLVSPPEAPGNILFDNGDLPEISNQVVRQKTPPSLDPIFSQDDSAALDPLEDLHIDERVIAFLDGFTVIPGRGLEIVGEVLQMTSGDGEWERWEKIEGFTWHQLHAGEYKDQSSSEVILSSESASKESVELRSSLMAPSEKDGTFVCESSGCFSGHWSCKGGDWKRTEEASQDRTSRKKLVLNDGYPLCQMPKSWYEDPRWQHKDELYYPSQSRKLDLPPWACTSPDEWNDNSSVSRSGQSKPNIARGFPGMMLPVVRINACVVKDHDTVLSDPRVKARGEDRYSSNSSRNYHSVTSEMKRSSSESLSRPKNMHERETHGSWNSSTSFSVPKDRICTADELQLNFGDWYYFDGAGHERGPLSFSELQVLADQGVIQKRSSAFRTVDKIWVPVTSATEAFGPKKALEVNSALNETAGDSVWNSQASSMFHSLHPQFIGYTRGKLHELVMRSYKSREFAAAINEVLEPWINARQPKKEIEKHIYNSALKSDQMRVSKRLWVDGSEDEYDMEDALTPLNDEWSFDDICGDANFSEEKVAKFDIQNGSWVDLEGRVLARVFHFLRADVKSLASVALTCKLWRSVLNGYKQVSKQVDLSSIAPNCNDARLWNIMKGYNKEKVRTLVLRGCTSITSGTLEEVLQSFMSLSSVDIRGCNQLEDLASKFPHINWIRSPGLHSKARSLKHLTDRTLSASRIVHGLDHQTDDSNGLRDYLESSDRRDSAKLLFRQSLYKRSKLFDARKSSSILSKDAHLRRLAMRKSENGYKRMEQFLALSLKDIMKENTIEFFGPKVAEIENRMRSGYYAGRGLSSVKDDISRMCRDAIKSKNRGDARNVNRIITLFIRLATSLEGGSMSSFEREMKTWKEDSPPGFSLVSSKHKKIVTEKKQTSRSNGFNFINGISDYGDCASDREIRRRLAKLNKKSMDSGSETSDELDRSSDESMTDSVTTASDTESDPDLGSESRTGEVRGETYFSPDDAFDSLADEREWGARMTKASLVPPVTRKYEVIDHYVVVADEVEVRRKMHVSLPEDFAEKLNAQRNGTEESDMEIPEVKDYRPRKRLGDEVIEQEVYGIDPYTHNLLLDSMPEESDWSLPDKHVFIEDVLLCTLNKLVRQFIGSGNTPMIYPLKPAFEEILDTAEEDNDLRTLRLCEFILKNIDSRPEDNYVAYRKGLGVVCNKEGGFGEDDFVVEFLGEVYPAWKWFEKQDGIRSLQKNSKDPAPEFYNIYLERPKGDADGYDLVVVDAMHKANYASRICHSCRPNCEAKVTAVDGQYQIGIYTVRPIQFGEEITFDYNSVTESKEEYEASVCLCGSQVCRGSYLNLTGEGAYQKVLKEYHGILDRHQLLLEACELNSVSEDDYIDLLKAGLGSCLLDGLPDWLIAYSARLVRFINFERTKLPKEILRHNLEEKKKYFADISMDFEKSDAEVQAEGVYNQRLQNLALTLDKVRYVMRGVFGDPKRAPPPLERLNPRETVSYLWNGEESLVEDLIQCIAPHMEDSKLSELKARIRAHDPSDSDDIETELQKSLIWLRDELRNLPYTYKCRHDAAADLVHIYAHTECLFRIKEYKTITSPPVYISPLDLCPKYADKLGSQGHEYCKTYGENYCLGQLIYWHNQANAEPDSSLARASRGCLSLPEIGSFYTKVQKPSRQRVYGPRTLKFMLSRMEKQPQRPWPNDRIWSFRSSSKIFGSPMLDAVLNKVPLDKEMVHWLKHRLPVFQAMWDS